MTFRCDNCGDEVNGVVIVKPKWWEFGKQETRICQRCAYNEEFGTNLDAEQWSAKINSPPKSETKTHYLAYQETLNLLEQEGWHISPQTITHRDGRVTTYSLEKGCTGKILDIKCPAAPAKHLLLICGVNHSGIKPSDIARAPHLYTIPHQFSILCYDKDNRQLPPETEIIIEKIKPSGDIVPIDIVLYGDLALKSGERFKRKEERYYFPQGIMLHGGEYLRLTATASDIIIKRTVLFMKCDFLTKEN